MTALRRFCFSFPSISEGPVTVHSASSSAHCCKDFPSLLSKPGTLLGGTEHGHRKNLAVCHRHRDLLRHENTRRDRDLDHWPLAHRIGRSHGECSARSATHRS